MLTRAQTMACLLVVDDDVNVCTVLARALKDHDVVVAHDGYTALEILRSRTVDLLITDYLMPGMTGQELIDIARAEGFTCPVVVISGYAHLFDQTGHAMWEQHPHLVKPINFAELRTVVDRLLTHDLDRAH